MRAFPKSCWLALLLTLASSPLHGQTTAVPTPASVIGTAPGTDYFVADYGQITDWLRKAAAASDRIKLISIGKTAEGKDQIMAIVSSPENLARLDHYQAIARKLALGRGLDETAARLLAKEGRAVVWLGAGIHANEVANAQAYPQIINGLLTGRDEETTRILDNVIALFTFSNPDGLDLIAHWYMAQPNPLKRNTETLPVPYQKYIGHDLNRDGYAALAPESANMSRILYRQWLPQIICDQHQPGPAGTIIYIPPANDPFPYSIDPLAISSTDAIGYAMHSGLLARGLTGSSMRSISPYSSWYNGSMSNTPLFHNAIGLLTEITGNPTPKEIALVPRTQLAHEDLPAPAKPGPWHLSQAIDYLEMVDRVLLDHAARERENLLYNRYVMAQRQIDLGSGDSWTVTPHTIEALYAAANAGRVDNQGTPDEPMKGYDDRAIIPTPLYDKVMRDPARRNPRAWIIDPTRQHDLSASVDFLNSLIRNGVAVQRADRTFRLDDHDYSAGTFIVRADQAFRPHILDMFEPQVYPHDLAYPGGPPVKPYDISGYTPAMQAGVTADRPLDAAPPSFPELSGEIEPPQGRISGEGKAGFLISHDNNAVFTLANRLLRQKAKIYWLSESVNGGGKAFGPGALWIPASPRTETLVQQAANELGLDALRLPSAPGGAPQRVHQMRIGLLDFYGGSLVSGWTRWLLDRQEFDYQLVYPGAFERGELRKRFDLIIMPSDIFGGRGTHARGQPDAADIPAPYRPLLGRYTMEASIGPLKSFLDQGGALIATGAASRIGAQLGLPVVDPLTEKTSDGRTVAIDKSRFYIGGSLLTTHTDPGQPLGYGMPEEATIFFADSPVFRILPDAQTDARPVVWFDDGKLLQSGWAIGEERLSGSVAAARFSRGAGRIDLIAIEPNFRGQSSGSFKLLLNGLYALEAQEAR